MNVTVSARNKGVLCSGVLPYKQEVRGRKYRAATLREAIDAAKAKGRA